VAVWYYAVCFDVLGLNGWPLHLLNLVELTLAAVLLGLFVWRESRSWPIAWLAAVFYAVHPGGPYAVGAWITNQLHLLATLVVLAMLLLWQTVRARRAVSWLWLLPPFVLATLVKEDSVMVAPSLLAMQYIRARTVGDVPRPGRALVGFTSLAVAALVLGRMCLLGSFGGYGRPGRIEAVVNFVSGPIHALAMQSLPHTTVAGSAAGIGALVCVAAGLLALRREPHTRAAALLLSGLVLLGFTNLPLVLISGPTRIHLAIVAATMTVAGAVAALWVELRTARTVRLAGLAITAGLLAMLSTTWVIAADFAPCSAVTLSTDEEVQTWDVVPAEIRAWLAAKPARCANGTARPLVDSIDSVWWNVHGAESGASAERWIGDSSLVFVRPAAHAVVLTLRSRAATEFPVRVHLVTDNASLDVDLRDDGWHDARVALMPSFRSWLRGAHAIEVTVSAGSGLPAHVDVQPIRWE
jgi:hypothetical protein